MSGMLAVLARLKTLGAILATASWAATGAASLEVDTLRVRVGADPPTIVKRIQLGSTTERVEALRMLGFDPLEAELAEPPLMKLVLSNLDEDADMEAVLSFEAGGAAITLVFDEDKGQWWRVAQFTDWFRGGGSIDEAVTLRSHGGSGQPELIVRQRAGGTGVSETELIVFRLRNGRAHQVFKTTEDATYKIYGERARGNTFEHAWVRFSHDESGVGLIVIDRVKTRQNAVALPDLDRALRMLPAVCEVYRWDESSQKYISAPELSSRHCGGEKPDVRQRK